MHTKKLCLLLLILSSGLMFVFANDTQPGCDGQRIPDLEKQNSMLECAVLIDNDLKFPRNITVHDDEIWLMDKGNNLFENDKKNGRLYRYKKQGDGYTKSLILDNLEDSNDVDVRQHSDGSAWLYFTTRETVQRFDMSSTIVRPEVLINKIPTYGWHKLAAIEVTQKSIFLTVPSSTDHCELAHSVTYPCVEEEHGTAQVRQYDFDGDRLLDGFTVVARGLRNTSAAQLTLDESNLIVADNGWDQINLNDTEFEYTTTPYDEINIIDLSKSNHFGWPYCFDNSLIVPPYREFESSCAAYQAAQILLPAHSAPLNMMYFDEELLVNLHGNNDSGAKTIAFSLDSNGLPIEPSRVKVNWDTKGSSLGRPMGLAKLSKRELLVTDDWNHQLIRLVFKNK